MTYEGLWTLLAFICVIGVIAMVVTYYWPRPGDKDPVVFTPDDSWDPEPDPLSELEEPVVDISEFAPHGIPDYIPQEVERQVKRGGEDYS